MVDKGQSLAIRRRIDEWKQRLIDLSKRNINRVRFNYSDDPAIRFHFNIEAFAILLMSIIHILITLY